MALASRLIALEELEQVANNLAGLYLQLSELESAQHEARVRTWFDSDSQFIGERDRIAEYNTLHLTPEIIKLKGDIAAAESRRGFLEFLIHWGPSHAS